MRDFAASFTRWMESAGPEPRAVLEFARPGPLVRQAVAETVFLGPAVLDVTLRPRPCPEPGAEKRDADIDLSIGGGAANSARAFQRAAPCPPVLAVVTGTDEAGNAAGRLLGAISAACGASPRPRGRGFRW